MISRSRIRALSARISSPVRRRSGRPTLEGLEGRTLLTGYTALSVTDLIADINQSNVAGGTNTITLTAPSTSPYTVTAVDNTTDGATGLPVIAAGNNLSIVGNGDTIQRSTVTGTQAFRLFDVAAGATLNLQGLTVQNGLASGSGVQAEGGAIYSQGTLSMDTVSVQNNTALGSDGENGVVRVVGVGILREAFAGSAASASGGGLYVAGGAVTLSNDTFSGNNVSGGKGGEVSSSFVNGGDGGSGLGGGICVGAGSVTLSNDALSGNNASGGIGGNGGIGDDGTGSGGGAGGGSGGGLYVAGGVVTLSNDTLSGNNAFGALVGMAGNVRGGTGDGPASGGGLYQAQGTVTLTGDTVSNNSAVACPEGFAFGGGLYLAQGTATLTNDTLSGNSAQGSNVLALGGALYVSAASALVNNSTFSHNTANGGIDLDPQFNPPPGTFDQHPLTGTGGYGGGIFISDEGSGSVTLNNSTLANNSTQAYNSQGGGLFMNGGIATLTNCTVSGNTAGKGGGLGSLLGYSPPSMTLTGCTISGNTGGSNGGGLYNDFGISTLTNCTINDNTASNGGGIDNWGTATTLTNCTISANTAGSYGGGIYNNNGRVTLSNCTISGNTAALRGGGLDNLGGIATLTGGTISGNTAGTFGGGLNNEDNATLSNCTISGNTAGGNGGGNGGGVEDSLDGEVTLSNCTISGNSTASPKGYNYGDGGGLSIDDAERTGTDFQPGATATLTDCTISDNSVSADTGYLVGDGGGLYVDAGETATLINCTVNDNSANDGGGLFINAGLNLGDHGAVYSPGAATLINCTVSGNSANGGGGGLYLNLGGNVPPIGATATLTNCTVSSNSAAQGGGLFLLDTGLPFPGGGTAHLNNTIVADQTGGGDVYDLTGVGALSGNNNLIGDGSGGITGSNNLLGVDPKLASLGNFGGPTQTQALLLGSPAIDAGNTALAALAMGTPLQTDQRGYQRVVGPHVDIGAYEVTDADRSVVTTSSSSVIYGGTDTVTLQAEDELGNNLTTGGLNVSFALGAGTSGGSLGPVTDNGNGTYTATFTATAAGTPVTITAAINAMPVTTTLPMLTVTPATLTVTANPETKVYGSADPTLTYHVSGLQFSDTAGTVLTGSLTRAAGETVLGSPYAISQGTLAANANYTIAFTGNSLVISQAGTTTALSSSTTSTVYGQAVTFTATVAATAPSIGTPTGSVTFFEGATAVSGAPLSGGVATLTVTSLAAGSDSITAVYDGDANFTGGSSPVLTQTVTKDATTSIVVSSANPSVFGQSVTFTATISPGAPGGGTPTGTVIFTDGSTVLGSPTLSGGVATLTTSSLSVSNHTMKVAYGGDGNFTGSPSSVLTQNVAKDATTTSVTASANPSVFGQSVTFTATVAAGAPGSGTPTGTVTFKDGSSSLGTATLSSGTASLTTSSLALATHSITVSYGGDANFTTSASTTLSQVVNKVNTTTSLVSATDPSVFGQAVTFTATVSTAAPGSGTPSGNVTFYDGSTSLGTAALSSGSASFTAKALPTGSDAITAVYNGAPHFTTSSSAALTQSVNQAGTTSVVTSSTNPSILGQSVTFTATVNAVAPGSGTPTGSITFLDGLNALGTATLSGGKASFKTSALAAGPQTITVSYSGDGNFVTSTSGPLTQTVNQAATTSKVTSSASPSVFGQSVTFTATVKAVAPGSGTPTGSVTFLDGSTTLGTGTLSGGTATFSISTLAVAGHSITVVYGGGANFLTSTSGILTQTVTQAATTSSVSSSVNPSVSGQAVTFSATITPVSPGSGTPTGKVTFDDGSTVLGTVTLTNGTASFTTSSLAVGTHSIKIVYIGDTNFKTSTSAVLKQVVNSSSNVVVAVTIAPSLVDQALSALVDETLTDALVSDLAGLQTSLSRAKEGNRDATS